MHQNAGFVNLESLNAFFLCVFGVIFKTTSSKISCYWAGLPHVTLLSQQTEPAWLSGPACPSNQTLSVDNGNNEMI